MTHESPARDAVEQVGLDIADTIESHMKSSAMIWSLGKDLPEDWMTELRSVTVAAVEAEMPRLSALTTPSQDYARGIEDAASRRVSRPLEVPRRCTEGGEVMDREAMISQARAICAQARPDYAEGFLSGQYDKSSTEMHAVMIALARAETPEGEVEVCVSDELRARLDPVDGIKPVGKPRVLKSRAQPVQESKA